MNHIRSEKGRFKSKEKVKTTEDKIFELFQVDSNPNQIGRIR